jgi:hypothetical protein
VKRNITPRTGHAVVAVTVTQHTAEPVIGVGDRRYLDLCGTHRTELRPVRLGKLVVTRVDAWERLFSRLADDGATLETANDDVVRGEPKSEADVWAALGRGAR